MCLFSVRKYDYGRRTAADNNDDDEYGGYADYDFGGSGELKIVTCTKELEAEKMIS